MTTPLFIDFETRSPLDLKKVGLYNYANHPETGIWCLAYAFGDGPVKVIYSPSDLPADAFMHTMSGQEVVAHNAPFELAIWNTICAPRYGWPKLNPAQMTCTMARCYAMSLPGTLENAAGALGLKITKDTDGRALMLRMCRPVNSKQLAEGKDKAPIWITPEHQFTFMGQKVTGEWALKRLGDYCASDVDVERAIYERTLPLSAYEKKVWMMDYTINQRGVLFDPPAVEAALKIRDKVTEELNHKMDIVTEGAVTACSAVQALKEWAADYGVMPDSLAKAELGDLLEMDGLPGVVKEAFELRREAGRATSVAKLAKIRDLAKPSGRVPNMFQYHGAGTGRFAGRGVQPHNFTRDLPKPAVVEEIMELISEVNAELIDIMYGPPLTQISKLLRGFITAGTNGTLIGGDYSNVEGRGIAWLAGEEWKIQAFRDSDADPDGPDVYEQSYAKTFGKDPNSITSEERQIGKVVELSMGYAGGVGAFQTMAGAYGVTVSDDVADAAKIAWREAHPKIKQYWKHLQTAAIKAVQHPGMIHFAGAPGRLTKFKKAGSFLLALLPSGRCLCYPYPEIWHGKYGPYLTYKSVPSADDIKRGRLEDDPKNTRQWARMSTYGGKLAENITQAICRDLLVDAMLRLEEAGYPVVLHVHDEAVVEGKFKESDRIKVQEIMNTTPPWAVDFPLKSECWISKRYVK